MEATKEKLLFLIESLRRCQYNATEIHKIMETSWPDDCLSLRRVQTLCKEFKDGNRDSFERKDGSGKTKSNTRTENEEQVRQLLEEDNTLTVQRIADVLHISHTMVQRTISEDLGRIWVHTKWVPHTLSPANKLLRVERCTDLLVSLNSRICLNNLIVIDEKFFFMRKLIPSNRIGCWVTPGGDEPVRQTARRNNMEKKLLVIIAVSSHGKHYYEILPRNQSIDSERYIHFLDNMELFYRNLQTPILFENMRLLHDNARPHRSRLTEAHLENKNVRLLRQPTYSPDCNICDRYIFPRLEAVRDGNFENEEELSQFLDQQLPQFTAQRMMKSVEELKKNMIMIIDNEGNYV